MLIKTEVMIFVFAINLASCGIKGPPLPPVGEEMIQKQKSYDSASESSSKIISADATRAKSQKNK